jgi:amidophosphoribosyltransferase
MRVSSPPFLNPCYFGTDIPDRGSLIANGRTPDEVAGLIGVDSLKYLRLEDLNHIVKGVKGGVCDGCFTGRYSVPVPIPSAPQTYGRSEE